MGDGVEEVDAGEFEWVLFERAVGGFERILRATLSKASRADCK